MRECVSYRFGIDLATSSGTQVECIETTLQGCYQATMGRSVSYLVEWKVSYFLQVVLHKIVETKSIFERIYFF